MNDTMRRELGLEVQVLHSTIDNLKRMIDTSDDISYKLVMHVLGSQLESAAAYLEVLSKVEENDEDE